MESLTPRTTFFARTFSKLFRGRTATGISPVNDGDIQKVNTKTKKDRIEMKLEDDAIIREIFLSKVFASISSIKASYAHLQYAQSLYDADAIQSADRSIVTEINKLSELKQRYLKKELCDPSPNTAMLVNELHEYSSLVKTFEIVCKRLDSQLRLKDSEIVFLKEKLAETNDDCRLLSAGLTDNSIELSSVKPSDFVAFLRPAVESVRSFVRLLIDEMTSKNWDLVAAASSMYPNALFSEANHVCFAFVSFVCREMFDFYDFDHHDSDRRSDYLMWNTDSTFAAFCRAKYLQVIHPKMEESFFGNLEQRNLVSSGEFPETPFFALFVEMARQAWLLRCLAFSFEPAVSAFQVKEGSRFSEVYMKSVSDEVFHTKTESLVAFTVVPGFRMGKIVVQCEVYLNSL